MDILKLNLILIKDFIRLSLHVLSGGIITILILAVVYLNHQPELKIWHTIKLDSEFTVSKPVKNFADYQALEERLFAQLKERVYDQIKPEDQFSLNRYHRGSMSDPDHWSPNWNRSFELSTDTPVAGVLLLHGMSDSPYSLHNLGTRLHEEGAHVVGLRIPGHGTAPSGLVHVRWQDMAAAVKLAVKHLHEQVGDKPVYIVGYSNGGALALHYALAVIEDPKLPPVKKLVLISPEIGVTKMAALAVWQERIGHILGLAKLKWNDVLPEYDPFKYNSFAINAGNQAYRLTIENRKRLDALAEAEKLDQLPPILAFQSVLDATVSARDLVLELFEKLPDRGHELVGFDINRIVKVEQMLKSDPKVNIDSIISNPNNRFIFSLVTNDNENSEQVIVRTRKPGQTHITETDIDLTWPEDIFSLGHIALPFPEQDPLYGAGQQKNKSGIQLGSLAVRGEKGMLLVPASDMLRIHWNPFYPYLEQRVLNHIFADNK
ncbi:MAG: alpha/beta hydrolase [Gammaproteobacteria bacterium]|nr:alpha/beta hydrolase [Gammaproteobacteria bacterium]